MPDLNKSYKLTLITRPEGVAQIAGDGTYYDGATAPVKTYNAQTGYYFVEWQKDGVRVSSSASFNYVVKSNTTLTAVYSNKYSMTLNPNFPQANSGDSTQGQGGPFDVYYGSLPPTKVPVNGSIVNLTFPAVKGYDFLGYYSGKDYEIQQYYNSNGTPVHVWDMDYNATLYAHWEKKKYKVTLKTNNSDWGSIIPDPVGTEVPTNTANEVAYSYEYETKVKLTARPAGLDLRYVFDYWSDGQTTSNSRTITVDGNLNFYAHFKQNPNFSFGKYRTRIMVEDSTGGTVSLRKTASSSSTTSSLVSDYGYIRQFIRYVNDEDKREWLTASGIVEATPDPGYQFSRWKVVSTSATPVVPGQEVQWEDTGAGIFSNQVTSTNSTRASVDASSVWYGASGNPNPYSIQTSNFATIKVSAEFTSLPQNRWLKVTNKNPEYGDIIVKRVGTGVETVINSTTALELRAAASEKFEITAKPLDPCELESWTIRNPEETPAKRNSITVICNNAEGTTKTVEAAFKITKNYIYKANGVDSTNATYYVAAVASAASGQSDWGTITVQKKKYATGSSTDYTSGVKYQSIVNDGLINKMEFQLVAHPTPGYKFIGWSYSAGSTNPSHAAWGNGTYEAYGKLYYHSATVDDPGGDTASPIYTEIKNSRIFSTKAVEEFRAQVKFSGAVNMAANYDEREKVAFSVVGHFEARGYEQLSVSRNDSTLGSVTGAGSYLAGSYVTATASAKPGVVIEKWELIHSGTVTYTWTPGIQDNPSEFSFYMPDYLEDPISSEVTAKVYFKAQNLGKYKVQLTLAAGSGGQITNGGEHSSKSYNYITAFGGENSVEVNDVQVIPNSLFVFSGWTKEIAYHPNWSNSSTWDVVSYKNPQESIPGQVTYDSYRIEAPVDFVGLITDPQTGELQYYSSKEEVRIVATANFTRWSGDRPPYSLLVKAVSGGNGKITAGADGIKSSITEIGYTSPSVSLPISCSPNTGYHFSGWTKSVSYSLGDEFVGSSSNFSVSYDPDSSHETATATVSGKWAATSASYTLGQEEQVTVSLVANFSGNTYSISFDKDGGTGGTNGPLTATYGSTMPVPSGSSAITPPTKSGYSFVGYYLGNTKYYNKDGTPARTWNKTENATLVAVWNEAGARIKVYTGSVWDETPGIKVRTSSSTWKTAIVRVAQADGGPWYPST